VDVLEKRFRAGRIRKRTRLKKPVGMKAFRSRYPNGDTYSLEPLTLPSRPKQVRRLETTARDPSGIVV